MSLLGSTSSRQCATGNNASKREEKGAVVIIAIVEEEDGEDEDADVDVGERRATAAAPEAAKPRREDADADDDDDTRDSDAADEQGDALAITAVKALDANPWEEAIFCFFFSGFAPI